jgi:hypothetical protein
MPKRPALTLSALLWGTAFATLGTAALVLRADARGVLGLLAAGHLTWAVAWLSEGRAGRSDGDEGVERFVIGVLATFGVLEGAGLLVALSEGATDQAVWFSAALSFAAAGAVSAWRSRPGDGSLAAQIFFHLVMGSPALSSLFDRLWPALAGVPGARGAGGTAPLTRALLVVAGVVVPLVFVGLLAALVLACDRVRAKGRGRPWAALIAHEAVFIVMAIRWAAGGL